HKVVEARTDKLGLQFGRDGYGLLRPADGHQLFFGPLDDAVREGESFGHLPLYSQSRYCASCHEGVIFGVHVYGTYSEWLDSPARRQGKQCQSCHMTPTGKMTNLAPDRGGVARDPRTLASHQFPGNTLAMLRQCLDVKATATRRGAEVAVTITIQAKDVGHRVPTGFIDRQVMLIVDAMDPAGRSLALQQGAVLPPRAGAEFAGKPGLIYAKQHLGGAARPLPFWRTAGTLAH